MTTYLHRLVEQKTKYSSIQVNNKLLFDFNLSTNLSVSILKLYVKEIILNLRIFLLQLLETFNTNFYRNLPSS